MQLFWDRPISPGTEAGRYVLNEKSLLPNILTPEQLAGLDRFDQVQLEEVVRVCQRSRNLSEAGRVLFAASRQGKKMANDADRLRKYLARFNLTWDGIKG